VPDAALPPIAASVENSDFLSARDQRLLRFAEVAASEAMAGYAGDAVPLLLAGPQNYSGLQNQLDRDFFPALQQQTDLPIDYAASRLISTGRTGVLEALRLADHYLYDLGLEAVLVGGVDTCQNSRWLALLDENGRIKSGRPGAGDSFVPGDGAGFLLLTARPANDEEWSYRLTPPGFAAETGHLYSAEPYLANGLDTAVKQALLTAPEELPITQMFSSMNGEHYWVKEIGVAASRSSHRLKNAVHQHPADCYGDLGAATGAALIALAYSDHQRQKRQNASLIMTSSDNEFRAATCLVSERISP
jgi:3-oxoacyl-[acyl-carrier-protein] synthase-1